MAGIAGILKGRQIDLVGNMLEAIAHRGNFGQAITEKNDATIGIVWSHHEDKRIKEQLQKCIFIDGPGYGHKAEVNGNNEHWQILRDEIGVAPMYYGYTGEGNLCFASEAKALKDISCHIFELQPGCNINNEQKTQYFTLDTRPQVKRDPGNIAMELLDLLNMTVTRRITSDTMGAWLSGGLDSSAITLLASPWIPKFHTFTGGLSNAPDFEFARVIASKIHSEHHQVIINMDDILRSLPSVIYHLESFDPLLVRPAVINYLMAEHASGFVGEVFSGEGGDGLFAGDQYLRSIPVTDLDEQLIKIISRLHNTSLQREDRCAAAHGLTTHVVYADPQFFEFALRIPPGMKLNDGFGKWILRKAMEGIVPDSILWRPEAISRTDSEMKFLLSDFVAKEVTDSDFACERKIKNGWTLKTKEELYYYRIFKAYFGGFEDLEWMGRIKEFQLSDTGN